MFKNLITYVFQDEYPWDVRVEKIIRSLARHNFSCEIVSRNRSNLPGYERLARKISVIRLPAVRYTKLNNVINFPAFFSPFWYAKVLGSIRRGARLLIVRDLPLAPTVVLASKRARIPVIIDMAENYPAMIADTWKYRGPSRLDYIIRNPSMLRLLEKKVVPHADAIWVVCEESKKRLIRLGLDENKISVVGNTPDLSLRTQRHNVKFMEFLRSKSTYILTYVGGLEESRGLDIAIRAMRILLKHKADSILLIVGTGSSLQNLRRLAQKYGISRNIYFAGWQDPVKVPTIISMSDVGIIPHLVTEHTNTTLPNKLFDYMLHGKPVIASKTRALTRIIDECNCGLTYNDRDPTDMAEAMIALLDPKTRLKKGLAGCKAIHEKYNWLNDEKEILLCVRNLILV